jgi:hypothetical protein
MSLDGLKHDNNNWVICNRPFVNAYSKQRPYTLSVGLKSCNNNWTIGKCPLYDALYKHLLYMSLVGLHRDNKKFMTDKCPFIDAVFKQSLNIPSFGLNNGNNNTIIGKCPFDDAIASAFDNLFAPSDKAVLIDEIFPVRHPSNSRLLGVVDVFISYQVVNSIFIKNNNNDNIS